MHDNSKKQLKSVADESSVTRNPAADPIAIIGIGCRYPGASNAVEFWRNLAAGKECIGPYPGDRFAELDDFYEQARRKPGRVLTDRGGFLADVAGFDSQFFEISPRESIYIDPQHRLLLEVAWDALEDAGQVRENYEGSATGVYAGLWTSEYEARLYESGTEGDFYSVTGCGRHSASGRLSFTFGFQGPSVTVDTACSSSLVAVHMACQALLSGEIDMALAGGANLILGSEISELFTKAKMLSPDGRCKFGDASADGFVRSEGAGIVVLKRLSRAVADNDPIYAVIRGSAVNNDGRSSGLLVTPSRAGQREMLHAAWKSAGIEPKDIRYIEMHGTGTSVGDPVEIEAVGVALADVGATRPCILGSVKTNIGHTESAAGVAGLIKTALALKHRMVPSSLHFKVPNPKIAWNNIPVNVAAETLDLTAEPDLILAGVNSFGITGTNAHVIVQEAERQPEKSPQGSGPYLLPISARNSEALHALLRANLEEMEAAGPEYPLRDVCYTASARRNHHEFRAAIVAENLEEFKQNITAALANEDCDRVFSNRASSDQGKIVFVAPGQGSQWLGMAQELYEGYPAFRQAFDQCDAAIAAETDWRLTDRVLGEDAELYLSQIDVIQPALFAMSVALAAVWRSWGVEPDAVVGHSMGEVAAAHIAGILNLEDAVAVICRRSRLMKTLRSAGSMASVELPLHEVEALLRSWEGVSVGASNGPHTTVISGDFKAIEALLQELEAKEIYCRRIKVDVASHSAQVEPILQELFTSLSDIRPQPARIPLLSTVTEEFAFGSGGAGTIMDAAYWVENLRRSVLFAPAIQKLSREQHDTFIELSPHPILLPSIEASAQAVNPRATVVASLRREKPALATMLCGLSTLYAVGRKIAWERLYSEGTHCVRLPQYPFQRERCWPEPGNPARAQLARRTGDTSPLPGRKFESSLQPNTLLWETELDIAALPYLNDHRVLRSAVFPASGYVEMALSAVRAIRPEKIFELRDTRFLSAAYIPEKGARTIQLALVPDGDHAFRFEVRSRANRMETAGEEKEDSSWTLHSSGVLAAIEEGPIPPQSLDLAELKARCVTYRDCKEHFARAQTSGLQYGPTFQLMEEVWVGEQESLCRFRADVSDTDSYGIHPAVLDAWFQELPHLRPESGAFRAEDTYLPVGIEKLRIYGAMPTEGDLFSEATLTSANPKTKTLRADLRLTSSEGTVLAEMVGLEFQWVARENRQSSDMPLYSLEWVEEKLQAKAETNAARTQNASSENCIVFADNAGVAEELKTRLTSSGARCTLVKQGAEFRKIGEGQFEIDPESREDLDRLFEDVAIDSGVPTDVVHLWTLGDGRSSEYTAEGLLSSQRIGSQQIPAVVQAITAVNWQNPPRLWLVTAGTMLVGADSGPTKIENSPMWGIGRTVVREHAELRATLVDLSSAADPREINALAQEIRSRDKEDQIALRGDSRYIARLTPVPASASEAIAHPLADGEEYRVEISATGILDNLELRSCGQHLPAPGEVAIEVIATGLNFIDVTKVMGICPGLDPAEPIQFGMECSGRVTAIGDGVAGVQVGDGVISVTPSMRTTSLMSSSICVPSKMVFQKPPRLSFEEAATTPIAFLTAYYSLVELAHLRKGDWVLIHAAAGGVGLAAIEIAKLAGANIIATVGSREKTEYLHSIGINQILNSRSLDFAAGVMEITSGRGVDIVLNSLTGEFISNGLEVLAPYGRFIELGKRDIYDDRNVGLKVFRKNLSFHAVDLAAAIEERRDYIVELLGTVLRHIESGEWRPLPVQSFSAAEPSVPFRFMAQARHIGKIAIRMDRNVRVLPATDGPLFSSSASYLITGGLGGVALTVADWMARNGAGHLVLLSRREPSEESASAIRKMEESGARVTAVRADVTREADLAKVFESIHTSGFPLKGIMHAAALVDDALIVDMSPDRFIPVMAPKIAGAWNLYKAAERENLDFFVLFSSIGSVHPQPGMASYAAANAFLDSFAHYLRTLGIPAVSVNWGGWEQIGLARAAGTGRSIEGYDLEGLRTFSGNEGLEMLRRVLETSPIQAIAVPINAEKFSEFHGPSNIPPAFSGLVSQTQAKTGAQSNRSEILDQLTDEKSADLRLEIFEAYLQSVLGRVLKLAAHRIDRERPLGSMGLDSLMGLEFVRRLSNALEIPVPATVVFNYPTIKLLAVHLLRRMHLEPIEDTAAEVGKQTEPHMRNVNDSVAGLSGDLSEEDALQALIGNGQRSS